MCNWVKPKWQRARHIHHITQPHGAALFHFLSKPWNSGRQKLSNSPEQFLLLLLILSRELGFNSLQKVFWLQGNKKTKQKKIKGRHQSNSEKIRRQKNGRFPAHGRGCKWRIFKVSNPNSPRILEPHQLWPWAPAWGSRGWFGAGSDGEPQRGSVHMAEDQARLWFCTLFPMKHHFLPFHEQIQNYEKKQGLILGKSCKLRIWKVGSWTSLPPWFVTALQCTDF